MNRGYVRLWRKSLDAGWIKNNKLWTFWTYCLMKASYKKFDAIVGLQKIHLMPGQFIFGRRIAAKETGLTERQIRTILAFLKKAGNLTIKTTSKFSIITIVNWDIYQGEWIENDHQNDQQVTSERPHTNTRTHKKETPEEIFSAISLQKNKYDQKLIERVFQAIAITRKTGKVADSILLAQLKSWERYPVEQVEGAIRVYLDKDYAGQGKDERYLAGIIRKQRPAPDEKCAICGPRLREITPENIGALYEN